MAKLGLIYGIALIAVGGYGYWNSGGVSVTALIPAFLGAPVAALSALAMNPKFLKLGMHVNVVIALAGFTATLKDTAAFIGGKEFENPMAAYSKSITCVLSLIFIVLSVRSFIEVRKARKAQDLSG